MHEQRHRIVWVGGRLGGIRTRAELTPESAHSIHSEQCVLLLSSSLHCCNDFDVALVAWGHVHRGASVHPYSNVQYVQSSYAVSMTGINVNCRELDIPSSAFQYNATNGNGGVIFHSEANFLYLQEGILTTVVESLQGLIHYPEVNGTDYGYPLCYNLTGVKHPKFPSMSLQFAGVNDKDVVEFPLARENLFVPATDDGEIPVECLAMHSTGDDTGSMFVGKSLRGV